MIVQEDHELALQREVLQGRYLPESHYYGGEDTLGTTPDKTLTIHQRQNNFAASAGPVELKLGINSEELERVLSELEVMQNEHVFARLNTQSRSKHFTVNMG